MWLSNFFKGDPEERFQAIMMESFQVMDYEEIIPKLEKFVDDFPDFKDGVVMLSRFLSDLGRVEESISILDKYCLKYPDDYEVLSSLGRLCYSIGDYRRAKSSYERLVSFYPEVMEVRYGMAIIYDNLGEIDNAIESIGLYLRYKSDDAEGYALLGELLEKKGNLESAAEAYERSLELDKGSLVVPGKLVKNYARRGKLGDELPEPLKGIQGLREDINFLIDYGEALEIVGRYEEAAEKYIKIGDYYYGLANDESNLEILENYRTILEEIIRRLKKTGSGLKSVEIWKDYLGIGDII
jgi:tetratricopeptide (TPR) repeat protein